LHSFVVLCETNILSLVSQNLNNFYQIQTKCYKGILIQCFSPQFTELNEAKVEQEKRGDGDEQSDKKGRDKIKGEHVTRQCPASF